MRRSEFERHVAEVRSTLDDLVKVYRLAGEVDRMRGESGRSAKGSHSDPTAADVIDPTRALRLAAQAEAARQVVHAEKALLASFRGLARVVDAAERALAARPSERLEGRFVTKAELEEARRYAEKRNR
jgi:hypothetical protein